MNQTTTTVRPIVARVGLENARWEARGNLLSILLSGEETDGQLGVTEITEWRGAAPPRHIHHREDELIYVLDGELTVELAGQTHSAPAGTLVFVPRGTEHGFAIESERARLLGFFLPAGLEELFRASSSPAPSLDLPPGPDASLASEPFTDLAEFTARYGTELTGPPVEPARERRPAR